MAGLSAWFAGSIRAENVAVTAGSDEGPRESSPEPHLLVNGPTPSRQAGTIADALVVCEALDEVLDPDVADKLESGEAWEVRELPKLGKSLVRVEAFIEDRGADLSEAASVEVQRIYLALQHAHNELVFRSGALPEPSIPGYERLREYQAARQALDQENQHLSEDERSAMGAALKASMMRGNAPVEQDLVGFDTGENR